MTTVAFITDLLCRIDDQMPGVPKHSQAKLWPSEIITLGILHALKGVGNRAFYRWLVRDYQTRFPNLPEHTRLFRAFKTPQAWTYGFLATPTTLGVIDRDGIEWLHPVRYGRSRAQCGRNGVSHHRWMVGGKLCLLLNPYGLVVGWSGAPDKAHDTLFHPLLQRVNGRLIVFADRGFHATEGDPGKLKLCSRGEAKERMLVETGCSMRTVISHLKKVTPRVWEYFLARLAFTVTAFNVLVQWEGLPADENGFISLSIAEFSL